MIENKSGLTIVGVDEDGNPIEDRDDVAATIEPVPDEETLAGWGPSIYYITEDSSDITFQGLEFKDYDYVTKDPNKLFEIDGDGFRITHSIIGGPSASIYFDGDGVQSFEVIENEIEGSVSVFDGAGNDTSRANRVIENNTIGRWVTISGDTDSVGWSNTPSGAVTLTENTFTMSGSVVYTNGEVRDQPWEEYFTQNTFLEGASIALEDPDQWNVRSLEGYKVIWTDIQTQIGSGYVQPGDTLRVSEGTYEESVTISTEHVTIEGPNAGVHGDSDDRGEEATIEGQVVLEADGTTLNGFEVSPPPAEANQEAEAIRASNTPNEVTIQNTVVRGFERADPDGGFYGLDGINIFGGDADEAIEGATVRRNLVENLRNEDEGGAAGISVQGNVNDSVVEDNVVTAVAEGETPYGFGVVIRGTGNHSELPADIRVSENRLTDINADPDSEFDGVGFGVEDDGSAYKLIRNTIENNDLGIEIKAAAAETTVELNDISGNGRRGLRNADGETVNAPDNWWGHPSGPGGEDGRENPAGKPIGQGDEIEGPVDFEPWRRRPVREILPPKDAAWVDEQTDGGKKQLKVEGTYVAADVKTKKQIRVRDGSVLDGQEHQTKKQFDAGDSTVKGDITAEKVVKLRDARVNGTIDAGADVKATSARVDGSIEAEKVIEITDETVVDGDLTTGKDVKITDSEVTGSIDASGTVKLQNATVDEDAIDADKGVRSSR